MPVIQNLHPRVQYTYTGSTLQFYIPFSYAERYYVKVMVNDQLLRYDIDYTVPDFNVVSWESQTLYVTLILREDSNAEEGVDLHVNDTITIFRATAFDQQKTFPQNAKFDSQKITEALDKLTYQQQEQEDKFCRCLKVPNNYPGVSTDMVLPLPEAGMVLAWGENGEIINDETSSQKWAEWMDGPVDGTGYSAKYHATEAANQIAEFLDQGEEIVSRAEEQAELAEAYAERAQFGMKWTAFTESNWDVTPEGTQYQLIIANLPITVAVYSGDWKNKKLALGVDIYATSTGTKLISKDKFDGFALSCASIISTTPPHEQTVPSDEWLVHHNLGRIPNLVVLDSNNEEPVCGKRHIDFNTAVITFTEPQTGTVYFN